MRQVVYLNCRYCDARTPMQLNQFVNVYTEGEVWWETCSGCGREFTMELDCRHCCDVCRQPMPRNSVRTKHRRCPA